MAATPGTFLRGRARAAVGSVHAKRSAERNRNTQRRHHCCLLHRQCHNELRQWSVKMNVLIGVAFVGILGALGIALFFLLRDRGTTNRTVNALTARVALSVLVFQRTDSAFLTGLTYALTFVPALVGGILLSGLGDRYPRREVMVAGEYAGRGIQKGVGVSALAPFYVIFGVRVDGLWAPHHVWKEMRVDEGRILNIFDYQTFKVTLDFSSRRQVERVGAVRGAVGGEEDSYAKTAER